MNILLTGVTGFLGSSLVSFFQNQTKINLYGHSRNAQEARRKFTNYKIVIIDDCNTDTLHKLSINAIIHLAGIAHDLKGKFSPDDYYQVNLHGTKQLYNNFLNSSASQFFFLSSIKAAIDSWPTSIDEEIIPNPTSVYGKSKLLAERFLQSNLPENKKLYIFRPCMIHGPGNKGNLNVLYQFVKRGIPFPLASFDNKRSFLSIDNFNAIVFQFIGNSFPSGIYHLADTEQLSTMELYKLICKVAAKRDNSWNIPKPLVRIAMGLVGMKAQLKKLTENSMVSNSKVLSTLNLELPVTATEGLTKTIKAFHG